MDISDFRNKCVAAVTTYGSPAYVDIMLSALKSYNISCIVIDDGSFSDPLRKVCDKHGVFLQGITDNRLGHYKGDYSSICKAIRFAHSFRYDFLIKISRRWIPLTDPIESLCELYNKTHGTTFSSPTRPREGTGFGFRTDTFAVHAPSWGSILADMEERLRTDSIGLVEAAIHNYARKLQPADELYTNYVKSSKLPTDRNGYVHWDWLGFNSRERLSTRLQPEINNIDDYCKRANQLGLNYNSSDFILN